MFFVGRVYKLNTVGMSVKPENQQFDEQIFEKKKYNNLIYSLFFFLKHREFVV